MILHSMELYLRITPRKEDRIAVASPMGLVLLALGRMMNKVPVGWEA